ncbi:MAG: acetate/propionate family kinase [Planctomycetaceae bacterium]|jgi:acetate kinase|nr:acetate/propionate family kinase [Planctomycetaceae bacterium]
MKILVANLGSTSFKYSLYDMDGEKILARGRVERIGEPVSPCTVEIDGVKTTQETPVPDHAVAVKECLTQLTEADNAPLKSPSEIAAIGFKTVHAAGISGVRRVDDAVLDAMEEFNDLMPAHNPPYVRAMRLLSEKLPEIPLVACFETGFHQTIPDRHRYYGVPREWAEKYHIKRWGFHGASHRYIATRTAELLGRNDLKIISMHLGGSSSLCAINAGKSVAASMGSSAQTGLFQNNRVGDFDLFTLPYLMQRMGKTLDELIKILSSQSGLLGLSGVAADMRDVKAAADAGNADAELALEVFVGGIRHYLGAYLVELGGADVLVFTAGIAENNQWLRERIVAGLENFGIILDKEKNAAVRSAEAPVHAANSKVQIWVIPTNEEIIVARQVKQCLSEK